MSLSKVERRLIKEALLDQAGAKAKKAFDLNANEKYITGPDSEERLRMSKALQTITHREAFRLREFAESMSDWVQP
jgi:hypothetical protein